MSSHSISYYHWVPGSTAPQQIYQIPQPTSTNNPAGPIIRAPKPFGNATNNEHTTAPIRNRNLQSAAFKYFDSDPITVLVGPEAQRFVIHENALRSKSRFFEAALSKPWAEARERRVTLPDDDPEVFKLYVQWLYTDRIHCSTPLSSNRNGWDFIDEMDLIIKAYCLGEKLQDVSFKDSLVDSFIALRSLEKDMWLPHLPITKFLWENTPKGSSMRRLVVDYYVWLHAPDATQVKQSDCLEFLQDFVAGLLQYRSNPIFERAPFRQESTCAYHEHGTKACYKQEGADVDQLQSGPGPGDRTLKRMRTE
ncbi:hypothetical protein EV356DRAFT_514890 [Viridothelium virens]|uniref:BTB domain-containing protein n=1 Tax=Viridothelium virens TaxID=1048519 RepID=A0A6A6HB94_VIRVR|nr:hypothetical protein EV356DRAFT_514890 [Viridothelium virens]